ncbi:DUF4312 family protein [Enterobacter cloacae subsp. cloacae]|nr:DUF4312 family protein [Enterobacter cloacae subsp. cloacae]
MKEQFTTHGEREGKGDAKARAFADALNHVQAAGDESTHRISYCVLSHRMCRSFRRKEAVRKEAFLFFFCAGKTHLQRGAGCDRQRDRHQSRRVDFVTQR